MTRQRKLKEVLNVRLDAPLAREIARIAGEVGQTESEVARTLLGYGIEVKRRLDVSALSRPFAWRDEEPEEPWPGIVEIEARWRPMTEEEIDEHRLRGYVGYSAERDAEGE
jgi:hypothetical protein